jgi:hypothetical protein
MALSKSAQTPQASTSRAAGAASTDSSWTAINYGVSGVMKITNGGTGPSAGCNAIIEVAQDSSGTGAMEYSRQNQGDLTASAVVTIPFGLGVGGLGGDFSHYRTRFSGNTGQAVTVEAQAMTTTAL